MRQNVLTLVKNIRDKLRARALIDVPTFRTSKNGAIRILIYPCTSSADYWLGGLSDIRVVDDSDAQSRHNDIADYEWTFPVVKGRAVLFLLMVNSLTAMHILQPKLQIALPHKIWE